MSSLCVVQARCHSKRFPFKVFERVNRVNVITRVVRSARMIPSVSAVVVAVPRDEGDVFARSIRGVRGRPGVSIHAPYRDEDDVLGRFVSASEVVPTCNVIVRVTSDCPMLRPDLCGRLIDGWRASGREYGWLDTHSGGWPDGLDCEVFTRDLLRRAHEGATEPADKEHVTTWMRRNAAVFSLPLEPEFAGWPKCSIDTPDDLERVRALMC